MKKGKYRPNSKNTVENVSTDKEFVFDNRYFDSMQFDVTIQEEKSDRFIVTVQPVAEERFVTDEPVPLVVDDNIGDYSVGKYNGIPVCVEDNLQIGETVIRRVDSFERGYVVLEDEEPEICEDYTLDVQAVDRMSNSGNCIVYADEEMVNLANVKDINEGEDLVFIKSGARGAVLSPNRMGAGYLHQYSKIGIPTPEFLSNHISDNLDFRSLEKMSFEEASRSLYDEYCSKSTQIMEPSDVFQHLGDYEDMDISHNKTQSLFASAVLSNPEEMDMGYVRQFLTDVTRDYPVVYDYFLHVYIARRYRRHKSLSKTLQDYSEQWKGVINNLRVWDRNKLQHAFNDLSPRHGNLKKLLLSEHTDWKLKYCEPTDLAVNIIKIMKLFGQDIAEDTRHDKPGDITTEESKIGEYVIETAQILKEQHQIETYDGFWNWVEYYIQILQSHRHANKGEFDAAFKKTKEAATVINSRSNHRSIREFSRAYDMKSRQYSWEDAEDRQRLSELHIEAMKGLQDRFEVDDQDMKKPEKSLDKSKEYHRLRNFEVRICQAYYASDIGKSKRIIENSDVISSNIGFHEPKEMTKEVVGRVLGQINHTINIETIKQINYWFHAKDISCETFEYFIKESDIFETHSEICLSGNMIRDVENAERISDEIEYVLNRMSELAKNGAITQKDIYILFFWFGYDRAIKGKVDEANYCFNIILSAESVENGQRDTVKSLSASLPSEPEDFDEQHKSKLLGVSYPN